MTMREEKIYYVYIITNKYNTVLYIGVTNDLVRRLNEHKNKIKKGFTQRYNLYKLIYYEMTTEIISALNREKEIKKWSRKKKKELINTKNRSWKDLGTELEITL